MCAPCGYPAFVAKGRAQWRPFTPDGAMVLTSGICRCGRFHIFRSLSDAGLDSETQVALGAPGPAETCKGPGKSGDFDEFPVAAPDRHPLSEPGADHLGGNRRDVGDRPGRRVRLVLADDPKDPAAAVVELNRDGRSEAHAA